MAALIASPQKQARDDRTRVQVSHATETSRRRVGLCMPRVRKIDVSNTGGAKRSVASGVRCAIRSVGIQT
eukprot:15478982-Alexandrium_andersonii.AAC.1